MSEARDVMLQRIRAALAESRAEETPLLRDYRQSGDASRPAIITRFVERVEDYKATVVGTTEADLTAAMTRVCAERALHRLVVPVDVPDRWLPAGAEVVRDEPALTYAMLDEVDAALTGCRLGIAQTGTIVLDGGAFQGRRALSLIPDTHLCVVRAGQVVDLVPEAIAALNKHAAQPMTFISGPSATSDIELSRVEGVHGPRTLIVFLLADPEPPLASS